MSAYPDGLPMYCRVCLTERRTHHKHETKNGKPCLAIYCPSEHFVTRFIPDSTSTTGWKLDRDVYRIGK